MKLIELSLSTSVAQLPKSTLERTQGAPTCRTPTRGELNRVLHSGRGYTRSGQGAGQTRASRTRLSDQPGAGNQLVGESTPL